MKNRRPYVIGNRYDRFFCLALILATALMSIPVDASGFVYHAARRSIVQKILNKGICPHQFRSIARFGKKFYVTKRPSTALAERGKRSAIIRMRVSKQMKGNIQDFRRPTPVKLRHYVGNFNLRGTVKKGVIGPKIGRKIGKVADLRQQAIMYRSVKTGGTNMAVPASMLRKHPHSLYQKTEYLKR